MQLLHDVHLIKGSFSADEAKEVLTDLYQHKVAFHERQNSTDQGRSASDLHKSSIRIRQLQADLARIQEYLKSMKDGDLELDIECTIRIQPRLARMAIG